MKKLFKNDDPRNVNCLYFDLRKANADMKILNILEIVDYIKTGIKKNSPNLIEIDKRIMSIGNIKERSEKVIKLPSIQFGLKYDKNWLKKPTYKPSNLVVFNFISEDENTREKLEQISKSEYVLLSYNDYHNGKTMVVKTNNPSNTRNIWSFNEINNFFHDNFGICNDFDLTSYNIPLRFDPNVWFNPNVISFGEWLISN